MSYSFTKDVDFLLSDAKNPESFSQLIRVLYQELRQIAAHYFQHERPDHTLQPTALVHELFIRLGTHGPERYHNRAHFFGVAARAMRQILVERARAHGAQKRGGPWQRVPLEETGLAAGAGPDYLALHEALDKLERLQPDLAELVEFRVFGNLTFDEIAKLLGKGNSTVRRDWSIAKKWLEQQLERGNS